MLESFFVELGLHLLLFTGKLLEFYITFQTQALMLHHLSLNLVELSLLGGAFLLQIAIDFLKAIHLLIKLLKLVRLAPVVRFKLSNALFGGVLGVFNLTVLDFDLLVFVGYFFVVRYFVLFGSVTLKPIQLLAEAFPLFLRFEVGFFRIIVFLIYVGQATFKFRHTSLLLFAQLNLCVQRLLHLGVQLLL